MTIAWSELSWFLWIPPFKIAWLLTTPLALFHPNQYQRLNERLIETLNRRLGSRSAHLVKVREASHDLETFWHTFDGAPEDIALYGQALDDPRWFVGKSVLDVGCGVGRKSYELIKAGAAEVVGVDTSKRNIDVAIKMTAQTQHLSFVCTEASALIKDYHNVFDFIISFTVFEHVDDVGRVLHELYELQRPGGKNVMVYNHYLDRYGSHLKEFINFPWPQLIWPESVLFGYWNRRLVQAQKQGGMGYFPANYQHGIGEHNNDCFMNLNKHTISDVERLIAHTPYILEREYRYSTSPLLQQWPWVQKTPFSKYLEGSVAYVLRKPL